MRWSPREDEKVVKIKRPILESVRNQALQEQFLKPVFASEMKQTPLLSFFFSPFLFFSVTYQLSLSHRPLPVAMRLQSPLWVREIEKARGGLVVDLRNGRCSFFRKVRPFAMAR